MFPAALAFVAALALSRPGFSQAAPGLATNAPPGILPGVKIGGSSNMHLVGHVPLGGYDAVNDDEIEQDASRPYAYVSMGDVHAGFAIIDLHDLNNVKLLYRWTDRERAAPQDDSRRHRTANTSSSTGATTTSRRSSSPRARPMPIWARSSPTSPGCRTRARSRSSRGSGSPKHPGLPQQFVYRHSDGHTYLVATVTARRTGLRPGKVVAGGDPAQWKISEIPVPDTRESTRPRDVQAYHDFYVGYDPATHQDKFYGAGRGGYYVYDITDIRQPKLLTSITGSAGVAWGHTFTPTPDGRYAVTETEYQYAPLRIFDLEAGSRGQGPDDHSADRRVERGLARSRPQPRGALAVCVRLRLRGRAAGIQHVRPDASGDCRAGTTPASARTRLDPWGSDRWGVEQGAFGIDVRNRDGLIMISDSNTGAWFFKMDGFNGWNGHDWGMPNISSVQDYDHGPEGAQPPTSKPAA